MALSKNAQTVKYFAQKYRAVTRKGIPRKLLVKVVYLADLMSREYLGAPITSFDYYRYPHGPYDPTIKDVVRELLAAQMAELKIERSGDNWTKRLIDLGVPITFEHTSGELEIMRYVAETYLLMPMEELLFDVVYKTTPMLEQPQKGSRLPTERVNNRGKEAVGFDLEEVLIAEAEIAAGKGAANF